MNPFSFLVGLILLAIGVVFLGINYGWWPGAIWGQIAALWPLILIIIGLRFLIRNNALFLVLTIGSLVLMAYLISTNALFSGRNQMQSRWPNLVSTEQASFERTEAVGDGDTFLADLTGRFDITIQGGDGSNVTVNLRGPKELIEALTFEKRNDTVVLSENRTVRAPFFHWGIEEISGTITVPKSLAINLTTAGLSDIKLHDHNGTFSYEGSGASSIVFQNSTTQNPSVELSGAGRVTFDRCQGEATFQMSGAGDIEAEQCELQTLTIDASGGSKVDIRQGTIVNADIETSGASNINIPRPSGENKQSTSGASRINYNE